MDFTDPTPIEKDPKTWTSRAYLAREDPSQNQQPINMFDGIVYYGRKLMVKADYMINVGPIVESIMPKCASCKKGIEPNRTSHQDRSELKSIGRGRLFNNNCRQQPREIPEASQGVNQSTQNDKCVSFGAYDVRYFDPNERGSSSNDVVVNKAPLPKLLAVAVPTSTQKVEHGNLESVLGTLIVLLTKLNSKLEDTKFEDPYVRFDETK